MIVVYYDVEKGEHITIEATKIDTTICVDDLEIFYDEGIHTKSMIIEKQHITSINVKY